MEKYRFDDAYGKVYEYDKNRGVYLFIGTYYAFSIKSYMTDKRKTSIVDKEMFKQWEIEEQQKHSGY